MSSKRLPGKVLKPIFGKPLLQYLLESTRRSSLSEQVIFATSQDESDRPLVQFLENENVAYYCGSMTNVSDRFRAIIEKYHLDAFVRINGDSPLMDYRLIDKAVNLFNQKKYDLVTNVWPRSFPTGQSVEIMQADTFLKGFHQMSETEDFEHVTKFFYKNAEKFKILNFTSDVDYGKLHFSVDTEEDFSLISAIIHKMDRPHWEYSYDEIAKLYQTLNLNNQYE